MTDPSTSSVTATAGIAHPSVVVPTYGAIENGMLVMATPLASTMMACDQPLMDRDQWLAAMVESGPSADWDGTQLVLESGADRIVFEG